MQRYKDLLCLLPDQSGNGFDWPALLAAIPELLSLASTPQDPAYHAEGDVLIHTRMVCEALLTLDAFAKADAAQRFVLFYAALLHDIAKPSCTRTIDGRIASPGHSRRGAIDARALLWRAGVPFDLREQICRIIAHHQLPFFAIKGSRSGETPEFIVHQLSWQLDSLDSLATVAEADIRGRICADAAATLDCIALFRELAASEACLSAPRAFADAHTRLMYCRTNGGVALDYPFYQAAGSKVTVLSGLPASGKNTWVAQHRQGLPVISFDDAREELGLKHGVNAGAAVHLATDRAKQLLRAKTDFVWNATHLSRQMRQKTLDLLFAYDAEVEVVYLEQPEPEIKRRNTHRDTSLRNADIDRMLMRWEVPVPAEAHSVRYLAI